MDSNALKEFSNNLFDTFRRVKSDSKMICRNDTLLLTYNISIKDENEYNLVADESVMMYLSQKITSNRNYLFTYCINNYLIVIVHKKFLHNIVELNRELYLMKIQNLISESLDELNSKYYISGQSYDLKSEDLLPVITIIQSKILNKMFLNISNKTKEEIYKNRVDFFLFRTVDNKIKKVQTDKMSKNPDLFYNMKYSYIDKCLDKGFI